MVNYHLFDLLITNSARWHFNITPWRNGRRRNIQTRKVADEGAHDSAMLRWTVKQRDSRYTKGSGSIPDGVVGVLDAGYLRYVAKVGKTQDGESGKQHMLSCFWNKAVMLWVMRATDPLDLHIGDKPLRGGSNPSVSRKNPTVSGNAALVYCGLCSG